MLARAVLPASASREAATFVLARAITYATLFVGVLLFLLPGRLLSWSGVARPEAWGPLEITGTCVSAAGAALAVWCIAAFAFLGKGTPAPFDPPRRLVVAGPYRYVRNPMYIGAGLVLGGAALFYRSGALAVYVVAFLITAHVFVVLYEEPTLSRLFGQEYASYRLAVRRWLPRL